MEELLLKLNQYDKNIDPKQLTKLISDFKSGSSIKKIFGGQMSSKVYCKNKLNESCTYTSNLSSIWFTQMTLEIQNCNTLDECLQNYFQFDVVEEYDCLDCKTEVHAEKKFF